MNNGEATCVQIHLGAKLTAVQYMGAMGIIFFIKNFLIMVTFLKPKFQKIDPLEVSIPETVKKNTTIQ